MSDGTLMGGDVTPPAEQAPVEQPTQQAPAPTEEVATTIDEGPKAPEWLSSFEGLDEDVMMDPSLRAIKDPASLVKSYVHAQRKMGADKTVLPSKDSGDEEWKSLYQKLGLPTEFDAYEVKLPEETPIKDDLEEIKKFAYENNLLPHQAQALIDSLDSKTRQQLEFQEKSQQEITQKQIDSLREEWGDAFDQNIHKAKIAVSEIGGNELRNYLNETGLGNDPSLVKAFAKMGESMVKEDSFQGESKPAYALSPADAQQKINEYLGDENGAYFNGNHPDHSRIVNEVTKLYEISGR